MVVDIIEAINELKEIIRGAAAFIEIIDSTLDIKKRVDRLKKIQTPTLHQHHSLNFQKLLKKSAALLLTLVASGAILFMAIPEMINMIAHSSVIEIAGMIPGIGTSILIGAYTINAGMAAWKISALRREEMAIKVKDKDGNYKKDANGDFIFQKAKPTLYQLFIKNSDLKFENSAEEAEHKERVRKIKLVVLITALLVVSLAFPPAGVAIGGAVTCIVGINGLYTLYKNKEYFIHQLKNIKESIKDRLGSSDDAIAQKGVVRRIGSFLIEKINLLFSFKKNEMIEEKTQKNISENFNQASEPFNEPFIGLKQESGFESHHLFNNQNTSEILSINNVHDISHDVKPDEHLASISKTQIKEEQVEAAVVDGLSSNSFTDNKLKEEAIVEPHGLFFDEILGEKLEIKSAHHVGHHVKPAHDLVETINKTETEEEQLEDRILDELRGNSSAELKQEATVDSHHLFSNQKSTQNLEIKRSDNTSPNLGFHDE
jgi:hypothetical protein